MRIHKFLGSVLVAASAGLLMLGNAAAQVQPKLPTAQDIETKSRADTNIRLDERVQSKTKPGTEATEGENSNLDAKAEAGVHADGKAKLRTEGAIGDREHSLPSVTDNLQYQSETDLGIEFQDNQAESLTISSIQKNSSAAIAGLQIGDRIVSVNGRELSSLQNLNTYLSSHVRGQIDVIFDRDGRRYRTSFMPPGHTTVRGQFDNRSGQLMGATVAAGPRGIVMNDLPESSPLFLAGFHSGDEIVCFNGWSYRSVNQFVSAMNRMPKNQPIAVRVIRDGQWLSTHVTLPIVNSTYAEGSDGIEQRGQVRKGDQPPIPPAPEPADSEGDSQGDRYAQSQPQGRRTALRPNYEELSRGELQRKVDELQDENQKLRRELNRIRQDSQSNSTREERLDRSNVKEDGPAADPKAEAERNETEHTDAQAKTERKVKDQSETETQKNP